VLNLSVFPAAPFADKPTDPNKPILSDCLRLSILIKEKAL